MLDLNGIQINVSVYNFSFSGVVEAFHKIFKKKDQKDKKKDQKDEMKNKRKVFDKSEDMMIIDTILNKVSGAGVSVPAHLEPGNLTVSVGDTILTQPLDSGLQLFVGQLRRMFEVQHEPMAHFIWYGWASDTAGQDWGHHGALPTDKLSGWTSELHFK